MADKPLAVAAVADWRIAHEPYQQWIDAVEAPALKRLLADPQSAAVNNEGPLISIILPVFDTPETILRQALDSVIGQHYPRWQLCLVDDASPAPHVKAVLDACAGVDSRIRVYRRQRNGGISRASNDALGMVEGQYVALMDHDDVLAPHALLRVAMAVQAQPDALLLYSDSDELDRAGSRCNPFFKPDWNYDLLLGQNYFNHLTVYRADMLRELRGFREDFDASQDYDLALRAIERLSGGQIVHIPHILYHWREVAGSVARSDLGRACRVARTAVAGHLERTGQGGEVVPAANALIYNRVLRPGVQADPTITAVVYGSDPRQLGEACEQVRARVDDPSLVVLEALLPRDPEGASRQLNTLCHNVSSQYLCLLHAAVRVEQGDFFSVLASHLGREKVVAAGAKLVSREAGLACGALMTGLGPHGVDISCSGAELASKGYFGRLSLEQAATAVHGAALAVRTASFSAAGGISAGLSHPLLVGADISLKLSAGGETVIWTPCAQVDCPAWMLDPDATLAANPRELALFDQLWHERLGPDPFYNPNLDRRSGRFLLPAPPPSRDSRKEHT